MGTRHLTCVVKDGKNVVAQYGQWDGYPSGQGTDILSFVSDKDNMDKLKANLVKVRFFDMNGRDKEFIDNFNTNIQNQTPDQMYWHSHFITREIGGGILRNIANYDGDEILLQDESSFATDGLFCEGLFIIDLDKNTYEVNGSQSFDLDNLPNEKDFLAAFKNDEDE